MYILYKPYDIYFLFSSFLHREIGSLIRSNTNVTECLLVVGNGCCSMNIIKTLEYIFSSSSE